MRKKTYMILVGGLGNQMFMFASAYGLSRKWGTTLSLLDIWFKSKQRGAKFKVFTRACELNEFPKIRETICYPMQAKQFIIYQFNRIANKLNINNVIFYNEKNRLFNQELLDVPRHILHGYFQSEKYFKDYSSTIREFFTLNDEQEEVIRSRVNAFRVDGCRLVMVHVRREDSLVPGNGWTGLLSPEYYEVAIAKLGKQMSRLLVFSDSPAWCKKQGVFRHAVIVDEPDPVVTLRIMQYCDDFIIAGSTLSWWGAWLSQSEFKKVIAPLPFYMERDVALERDFIPASWERLEAHFERG